MTRLLLRNKRDLADFGLAVDHFPHYVNTDLGNRKHSLDLVLLTFIVKGRGQHLNNDRSIEVRGGSVGITYFDEAHEVKTDKDGMEIYNLLLDPTRFQMPNLPSPLNDVLHVVLPQARGFRNVLNRSIHLELPNAERLAGVVGLLHDELATTSPAAHVVNGCIALFLTECCRAALKTGIRPGTPTGLTPPSWVERIREFIDSHYRDPLTLDDFATLARMSRGYVCRGFKRYCGTSVFDYLIDRRVQAAMLQLRATSEQVSVIALNSGFNDLSHFNRTFRKRAECSPLEYRRRHAPQ